MINEIVYLFLCIKLQEHGIIICSRHPSQVRAKPEREPGPSARLVEVAIMLCLRRLLRWIPVSARAFRAHRASMTEA